MLFALTDRDRELLEAQRVRLGLRSHAETLRVLIRAGSVNPSFVRIERDKPDDATEFGRAPTAGSLHLGPVHQKPGSQLKK